MCDFLNEMNLKNTATTTTRRRRRHERITTHMKKRGKQDNDENVR